MRLKLHARIEIAAAAVLLDSCGDKRASKKRRYLPVQKTVLDI